MRRPGSDKSSVALKRMIIIPVFWVAVALTTGPTASAEEIALKDGTRIVGLVTRINSYQIEVATPHGKIKLNRSEVITISFPENSSSTVLETATDKQDLPKTDETLSGTQYVNRTADFSLTLPPEWIINKDLLHSRAYLAGLSSKDQMRFTVVIREEYPGSLESYKDLTIVHLKGSLDQFEELAESDAMIDGKEAMLVFYRGVVPHSDEPPVEFLSAIIPSGTGFTKITAWCLEPLFHDMQPTFEKIVNSYQRLNPVTTPETPARPR